MNFSDAVPRKRVEVFQLLGELIAQDSFVGNSASINNCYKLILDFLKDVNFDYEFSSNDGLDSLILHFGRSLGSQPNLIFLGHVDVVPCDDAWLTYPFDLVQVGDYLFGRGVTDMKGGVACFLGALKSLLLSEEVLDKYIQVILTGDEEIGSERGTKSLIKKGLIFGSAAICGEPTDLNIYNGSRGLIWGMVEIVGRSGHAGFGEDFYNPIDQAARAIIALQDLHFEMHHEAFPEANNRLNVTRIDSGNLVFNTIPYSVKFGFDLRILPGVKIDSLKREIDSLLEKNILPPFSYTFDVVREWPAYFLGNDNIFLQNSLVALKKVNPSKSLDVDLASDDSSWLAQENIPTILYGPGDPLEAHTSNEKVLVSDLLEAIDFYTLILKDI